MGLGLCNVVFGAKSVGLACNVSGSHSDPRRVPEKEGQGTR